MKFSITPLFVLLITLFEVPLLYADATISIRAKGQPDAKFYTKNGFVRVDISDIQHNRKNRMFFSSHTNELIMVDDKNRRRIDMSEQIATGSTGPQILSPSSNGQKPHIVKVGKGKIGKYHCVKYDAYEGKGKIAEACFANPGALDFSKEDYNSLKVVFRHMHKMSQNAGVMSAGLGVGNQDLGFMGDEVGGVPIATKNLNSGKETLVIDASNDKLAKELFDIPDYPAMQMPGAPKM